jgi:hypothetical protein
MPAEDPRLRRASSCVLLGEAGGWPEHRVEPIPVVACDHQSQRLRVRLSSLSRPFARKIDAQGWLDEETAGLVRGDWIDPRNGKITFAEWFADWSARQVWADGTLDAARQAAASVTFGAIPMRRVLRSHVQAWVKEMSTGLAASTTRMRYNYVHMAPGGRAGQDHPRGTLATG